MAASVLKNTAFSSINIYFEYIVGLVISIVIARSLGPSEYGIYGYLVKIAGISIVFTNAGINTGAIKFLSEALTLQRTDQIRPIFEFFQKVQRLKTLFVIIVLVGLNFIFPGLIVDQQYQHLLLFLISAIAFKSAHMYRVGVLKGHERFDLLAFSVMVVAPLNLLLIIGAHYFQAGMSVYYIIFAVVSSFYWIVSGFYLQRLKLQISSAGVVLDPELKVRIKHHLKIVTINTIVGGLVLGQCEVLLLKHLVDSQSVAFFTVGITIAGAALLLVPGVYSSVLFPVIARAVADVRSNPAVKIKESTRYLFVLSIMVALPTLVYGRGVVILLYGVEYAAAGTVLSIMVAVGVCRAFNEPVNAYLMSIDKQSLMLKISLVSFVFSLFTNYWCISQWGLIGAVAAYSIVSLVLMLVSLVIGYYYLEILPDFKKLLLVMLAACFALIVSVLASGLFIGIFELIVGYVVFGVVYAFFLLTLNALSDYDYDLILHLLQKFSPRLSSILCLLVDNRLKL